MHVCVLFHKTVTVWSGTIVKEEAYVLIYLILKCHLETFKDFKCQHLDKILLQWCFTSEVRFRKNLIYVITLVLVAIITISIARLSH